MQLQAKVAPLNRLRKGEASDEQAKVTIHCACLAPQNPDALLMPEDPKDRCTLVLKGGVSAIVMS